MEKEPVDEVILSNNAFDVAGLERVIRESTASDILTVIITKAPCVLLKGQRFPNKCTVDPDACKKCGACMKIGCPAITRGKDGKVKIDATMCNGCGLCASYCKFGAIKTVEN
jgi:indolepyruvate ferredoxin oxidoreductase alpha subunit